VAGLRARVESARMVLTGGLSVASRLVMTRPPSPVCVVASPDPSRGRGGSGRLEQSKTPSGEVSGGVLMLGTRKGTKLRSSETSFPERTPHARTLSTSCRLDPRPWNLKNLRVEPLAIRALPEEKAPAS
jgi:hypothetical protein